MQIKIKQIIQNVPANYYSDGTPYYWVHVQTDDNHGTLMEAYGSDQQIKNELSSIIKCALKRTMCLFPSTNYNIYINDVNVNDYITLK